MTNEILPDCYSLSPLQQGMLFHDLEAPRSGVYIQQIVLTLPEFVDGSHLHDAWQQVLDRHSALRTSFHCQPDASPFQHAHSNIALPWQEHDWSNVAPRRQESQLSALLSYERQRGFNLSKAPLLRLILVKLGEKDFRLVWTFHHILADGRSRALLLQEAFARYRACRNGNRVSFPETPCYSGYLSWLEKQDFARSRRFWNELLEGYSGIPPLNLGCKLSDSSSRPDHALEEVRLSPSATMCLETFATVNGLTLNALVQTAWGFLLNRYSRENDVVFGNTRACRKSTVAGAESMIGLLINTVPLRLTIGTHASVLDCLTAIRAQGLAVREFEHTPLAMIHAWSNLPAGSPLFETLVVFEHAHLETQLRKLGDEWSGRSLEIYQQTHYPLTLEAYGGESLLLRIEYEQGRFDRPTVRRMLGHLTNLLSEMVSRPEAHPAELDMLTQEEKQDLLVAHNQPTAIRRHSHIRADGSSTIHEMFEEQVQRTPQAVSVTSDGAGLTYEELNARANQLATRLRRLGVGPDVIVGLYLDRSIDLVVGLLAVLKAGGAYLPIDLSYPPERMAFMLEDAGTSVLLTQTHLLAQLPESRSTLVCIDIESVMPPRLNRSVNSEASISVGPESAVAGPDNLAYVIYTSGSTGTPKGVLVTHRNVLRLFSATAQWFDFSERDVFSLFHSYAFDFSVWEIWGALLHGGKLVVVPYLVSRSPELFYSLLEEERVTVLNQTPSAFCQLIQVDDANTSKNFTLRCVVLGGEALDIQSLKPWFERHGDQRPQLINMYGITETTVHATYRRLTKDDLGSRSVIGMPLPDLQIYILDDRRQPVPVGVPGEIYVGGAGLARGYLNRPQLSEERFIASQLGSGGRLYKTGDLARFLPGRDIEYLGRIDQQVKIRGFRIELGEIESVLSTQPGVRAAVVVARDDQTPGTKRLVAYVAVAVPGPNAHQLRKALQKQVPDYMVPAAIVVLDCLPLTNNGKVDRKALPAPDYQPESASYAPPETTTQQILADIWSEVLRVDRVGLHDNFFELGGDSILCIQVIARARQAGFALTPKILFQNQTIAGLAALVADSPAPTRTADSEQGSVPLTPIQRWFFEQDLSNAHHYNQAYLLTVAEPLQESPFREALAIVKEHHGSLRLRFKNNGNHWEQTYGEGSGELCFERVDLSDKPYPMQASALDAMAEHYQSSLRIDEGPLSRVVYFDLGPNSTGRLLFVLHHLIVDGVSWRILLEDVETAYRQLANKTAINLPAKSASFGRWAEHLVDYANSREASRDLNYWMQMSGGDTGHFPTDSLHGENTEGSTQTLTVELSVEETQTLLQQVPLAYHARINDVLVTALAKSLLSWTGGDELSFHLEGHGREDLEEGLDLTRTVGWFTSIFPVRLQVGGGLLKDSTDAHTWQPAPLLEHIKKHLEQIPRHGLSYSVLRYLLPESPLTTVREPEVLFNYFGQLDSIVAGSQLLSFAPELCGPARSPNQRRRYLVEINSAVTHGRFQAHWTFSRNRHRIETVSRFAHEFIGALRCILSRCKPTRRSQLSLGRVTGTQAESHPDVLPPPEDVYPLSPMQTLFFNLASVHPEAIVDQWHCTLEGELDIPAFQQAWAEAIHRHPILRSSFDDETSAGPVQRVHRDIRPQWTLEDWRFGSAADLDNRWKTLLREDAKQGFALAKPPLMRFALRQVTDGKHKFLWSLPSLLVDGWSWPLVFKCVTGAYRRSVLQLAPDRLSVRPFRDYIDWRQKVDWSETEAFWRHTLQGFEHPNRFGTEAPVSEQEHPNSFETVTFNLEAETVRALTASSRKEQLTLSTLIQGVWAIVLGQRSKCNDVVFGVASSGRPATLPGVEEIVGPFVNNLPVRVWLDGNSSLRALLKTLHNHSLEMSQHQFASLQQIQEWSQVSWQSRLFESLVVFQNYQMDNAVFKLGDKARIQDFVGPIHSTFGLTLVVNPRQTWRISLVYNRNRLDQGLVTHFARDVEALLRRLPASLEVRLSELQHGLSTPALRIQYPKSLREKYGLEPPKTDAEQRIAEVCREVLGLDTMGVSENFLEVGAHSLAIARLHLRLQQTLGIEFPIVQMFQYPSVRSLALYLKGTPDKAGSKEIVRRAQQQREALSSLRQAREVCR